MIELDLIQVNASSPYPVSFDTATHLYKFVSDYGVSFSVAFEKMIYWIAESHISSH